MTAWQQILCERMGILAAAVLLDYLFGDPHGWYHPVQAIGALISFLEKRLTAIFHLSVRKEEDCEKKLLAGAILVLMTVFFTTGIVWIFLHQLDGLLHPLRILFEIYFCYRLLAMRSLQEESEKVYAALDGGDMQESRKAVSMIVGRDTEHLTEEGVVKACVETVAENTSDGVIAPLFYMFLFGAVGGVFYKCVNTLDSMVGYRNDRYLYLGRAAAILDDVANFLPARLAAIWMIAASHLLHLDTKNACRIYRRDRKKHKSPNAAQTESVCAGALQVQLAGDAWYFGELYHKQTIGDPIRAIEREDIHLAQKLMIVTTMLCLLTGELVLWLLLFLSKVS